ncbi:MAG: hypothetical protein ACLP9Y_14580 [Mycobacterium sp.]
MAIVSLLARNFASIAGIFGSGLSRSAVALLLWSRRSAAANMHGAAPRSYYECIPRGRPPDPIQRCTGADRFRVGRELSQSHPEDPSATDSKDVSSPRIAEAEILKDTATGQLIFDTLEDRFGLTHTGTRP